MPRKPSHTPFKVYGWQSFRSEAHPEGNRYGQTREIVAARSKAQVARLADVNRPTQLFNLEETRNEHEIELALSRPEVIFWQPIDPYGASWTATVAAETNATEPDVGTRSQELPPGVAAPCRECPWRRDAVSGYLGPYSAKRWLRTAHGESAIACHCTIKEDKSWDGARQCAGAASFRANVCKTPRDPTVLCGPAREDVFASNQEFLAHHAPGEGWERSDMWALDEEER